MLNWLARYAAVYTELGFDHDGALRESVLDVGCGPHGLSIVAPDATFAGIDVSFATPIAPRMVGVRSSPGPLPFEDHAFDTVVCLDVLEHVPAADREGFVAELGRVCARRVLLACPSDEGTWVEQVLRDAYAADGSPLPAWLSEHDEHGLPTPDDISRWCAGLVSFRSRELPMVNGLLSGLSVLADMLPALADRAAEEWREQRMDWLRLFAAARFGSCFRRGYAIERLVSGDALVAAARFEPTVWNAARCPACARPMMDAREGVVVCVACGHRVTRDKSGAWDFQVAPRARSSGGPAGSTHARREPAHVSALASVPAAGAAEPAPSVERGRQPAVALILRPGKWARPLDWIPVLSAHVAAVPPDRTATLYLDARGADLDPDTIRGMVHSACSYLAGEADFAPVILMEGTVEPPSGARFVTSPDELTEGLGLPAPRPPAGAAAIIEHAVWAKTLVDVLQAAADRARYMAAPSVPVRGQPLVTVRIPTYGSAEDLVNRAIPSVLAGCYQNIELLVCSDGPQPHARAAVEAIGDTRVRYLELEARPSYPSWPENFWRCAGTFAANRMLDEARGDFLAALDHDDGYTHDHIPKLLGALHAHDADFVYAQAMTEWSGGDWRLHGTWPMVYGEVIHATVMYSARLMHMRYDPDAWLIEEPVDWNLWRRMRETGAELCHLPEPVAVHFKERSSIDHREENPDADSEVKAGDVLATSARSLLSVMRRQHVDAFSDQ